MNRSLFLSRHAIVAAAVVALFGVWALVASRSVAGSPSRGFVLTSGWVAVAALAVVMAYMLRKYAHKLGYSPEFRRKLPIAQLERAESRLGEIRRLMSAGAVTERAEILERANAVLHEEDVHRIIAVELSEDEGDASGRALSVVPTEPLGRVAKWLHAHVYYGVAMGFLVALHGGLQFDGGMAILLNSLTLVVIVTGLIGIALWAVGPGWLTRAEADLSIEKTYVLRKSLEEKVRSGFSRLEPELQPLLRDVQRGGDSAKAAVALKALRERSPGGDGAEELMVLVGQLNGVRTEYRKLARIKLAMNAWRVIHIPAALLLVVAVAAHVVTVWLY